MAARRTSRRLGTLRRAAALVLLAAVLYVGGTFVQVWLASRGDDRQRSDAIVVFGAAQYDGTPSPVLRARLDHAAALYRDDYAEVVVVTGAGRPGDRFTEAAASGRYLIRQGVPAESLVWVTTGRTSWESLTAAARTLRRQERTEVLLVSDPFHSARIAAMADELGLSSHVSPTRTSPIGGAEVLPHLGRETAAVAAGRVVGFRRLARIEELDERVREGPATG